VGQGLAAIVPLVSAASTEARAAGLRVLCLNPTHETDLSRRESSEGFTDREGPETVVLAPETVVELPDPLHFAVQPGVADPLAERRLRFEPRWGYPVPRLCATRLADAIVDTRSFVIMPDERTYLVDSVRHPGTLLRWGYERLPAGVLRCEARAEMPEREERVVVLGAQSNRNYSHWLIESVIRVLLFKPLDDGTRHFLTPPLTDWQRQALALVGVDDGRILEVEREGPVRFREVVAVSRGMGGMSALRPAAVAALAGLARAAGGGSGMPDAGPGTPVPGGASPATTGAGGRRIYCSRAGTRHRHMTNEPEIAAVLARHGFESVRPETLPFAQQIELFAQAEAVFALHGSALTNIVFSPPGTVVIELQAEEFNRGGVVWNWTLAGLCEQPFVQVVCPLADSSEELPHASRDVTVDPIHLDALLYRVLPG